MIKLFRCIKNWFFCKKYPFWKITDSWYDYNTGIDDRRKGSKKFFIKYDFTWYDDIPYGWQKAFGKKLSKEIKKTGKELLAKNKDLTWSNILKWEQIKEKWGELRLYASASKEIMKILEKYELISIGYCINCGKPARYVTKGWIEFYCEDCMKKEVNRKYKDEYIYKDEFRNGGYEDCRLTKKDIPIIYSYHKSLNGKIIKKRINIKKKYNIDFKEIWGLK